MESFNGVFAGKPSSLPVINPRITPPIPFLLIRSRAFAPRTIRAQNPLQQQQKPRTNLAIPFRFRLDSSALVERLALCAALGAVALIGVGLASAEVHRGGESAPVRYPCEDVVRYYSGTEGLEGGELMAKINVIISGQRSLPYKKVWDALKILDAANIDNPEASSDVIDIYSLRAVPKILAGKPQGWNREHLWPRSYGLIDAPSLTDLHNIRPANANVNSARGNKYYGECISESSSCLHPANAEAAPDTETDSKRWAPPLKVRGDIARSLMYMAVRYGWSQQPDGSPHLLLSNTPSTRNREMGLLSSLLKWNELDPPSKEELLRNDRICSLYQHNRNPFVDHPEYANLIWNHSATVWQPLQKPLLKAWINEFHYNNKGKDENEFIEIAVGPSVNAAKLRVVLYNGANGKVYASLPLEDNRSFIIASDGSSYILFTAFLQIQNGPCDGIALVSIKDESKYEVIQFLSYDGTVRAIEGPAKGMESVDIKVQETEESSKFDSIGLTGNQIREFEWTKFIGSATPGKPNPGQNF